MIKLAVRSAASITPPVAPNITPAPVCMPNGESKGSSGSAAGSIWSARSKRTNSRVVSTKSTSKPCAVFIVGNSLSAFLATQGITDTQKIFSGSVFNFFANQLFTMLPNICCGDFALDSWPTSSGYCPFKKRTQPGQQLVNIGQRVSPPAFSRCRNSFPSSIIVRSAEKLVSNTY